MERSEFAVFFPRVVSATIKPFMYTANCIPEQVGEAIEIRAVGSWKESFGEHFPVSVHITVPPGCPFVPPTGDHVKVTVERCTDEEQLQASTPLVAAIRAEYPA